MHSTPRASRAALALALILIGGGCLPNPFGGGPPSIESVSPSAVTAGSPGLQITIRGKGFPFDSVVFVNGSSRSTDHPGIDEVRVQLTEADLARVSTVELRVGEKDHPEKGSAPAELAVGYTLRKIDRAVQVLVWDPMRRVMYFSTSSYSAKDPSTIGVLDPFSGEILSIHASPSPPLTWDRWG